MVSWENLRSAYRYRRCVLICIGVCIRHSATHHQRYRRSDQFRFHDVTSMLAAPYCWHRRQVVRCLRSKPSTISSVGAPISSVIGSSKRQDMKLATFGHSGSSGAEVIIRPRTDRFQVAITVPRRTTSTAAFCRSGAPRWGPEGRDAWVKPCSLFREQCRNWAVKRSG